MGNIDREESGLCYRHLSSAELHYIGDIDRSEQVRFGYLIDDGHLTEIEVNRDVPGWHPEGDDDHTISAKIAFCRDQMDLGAAAIGAFSGSQLVGLGVLLPRFRGLMENLAVLYVSRDYRRKGIAVTLIEGLFAIAKERGAATVYVSATPSESAVGFYRRQGFELAEEIDPELYALEPEDIHMVKSL